MWGDSMLENIGAKQEILNCVEYVEHDHKEANVLRSICLYFFHHKDKVNILTAPFSSMEDPKSERTSLAYFWLSKLTQYISLNDRKEPQTDL